MAKENKDVRTLISMDGELVYACRAALRQSAVLDAFADAALSGQVIPVSNVSGEILRKILEYCKYHRKRTPVFVVEDARELTTTPWCKKFIDSLEPDSLSHIITSAYYLDIPALVSLGCKAYARMMWASKTLGEMADLLGLDIELTPEDLVIDPKVSTRKKSKTPQHDNPVISRKKMKAIAEGKRCKTFVHPDHPGQRIILTSK